MPPIDTPDKLFHDGNPATGAEGTIVPAEHLNNEQASIRDVQSEMIAILTAAAMAPDSTAGQLLAALNKLYAPGNDTLGALASLVGAANKLPYFTGPKGATLTDLTKVGRDIIGQTDIAAVLQYLGLGEAAKRDVGTGVNQIPDMNSFQSGSNGFGTWMRLPSGIMIQFGLYPTSGPTGGISFPAPFTSSPSYSLSPTGVSGVMAIASGASATGINDVRTFNAAGNMLTNGVLWIAIGKQ